ncbi:MAG: hypothetical protein ACLSAH_07830 [Bilophila wadsworthia]
MDGLHLETYVRADADGVASCAAGLLPPAVRRPYPGAASSRWPCPEAPRR